MLQTGLVMVSRSNISGPSRGDFGYGAITEYHDDPAFPARHLHQQKNSCPSGVSSAFSELSERVSADVFAISNQASALDRLGRQINRDIELDQIRTKINGIQQQIGARVQGATLNLKEMASLHTNSRGRAANQERLHMERLRKEFQDAVQQFSSSQKLVAEKMKDSFINKKKEAKAQSKTSVWMDADDLLMTDDQKADLMSHDASQQQKQMQLQLEQEQAAADLAAYQEREDAIQNLEREILDINDIFKELGTMISEQGEVIDSIEVNVEKAHDQVEAGAEHLDKAKVYQAKSRKKMCILLAIFIIIAAVVALIIYLTIKH